MLVVRLTALLLVLATAASAAAQVPPRTDLHGDPLPAGAIGRLGTVRWRHATVVESMAFLPGGEAFASFCFEQDGTVHLWDLATGKERRRYVVASRYHWDNGAVFAPDGKFVALSINGVTTVCETGTGKRLHGFDPDPATETQIIRHEPPHHFCGASRTLLRFNPDASYVRRWDLATGKELPVLEMPTPHVSLMRPSPDGKLLATLCNDADAVTVTLWDLAGGRRLYDFEAAHPFSRHHAFAPNGRWLAGVGDCVTTAVIRDARTGKVLRSLPHPDGLCGLAFAPDGATLATIDRTGGLRLWPLDGKDARLIQAGTRRADEDDRFRAHLIFSPDGKVLAVESFLDGLSLWDVATGRRLHSLDAGTLYRHQVGFAPDGKTLAALCGNRIRLWDVSTGRERLGSGHDATVSHLAVSADGRTVATASADGTVGIWDAPSTRQRIHWQAEHGKRWSEIWQGLGLAADGTTLTTLSLSTGFASHWETATGKLRRRTLLSSQCTLGATTPDGRTVAWGLPGGSVHVLDVTTGKERCRLPAPWVDELVDHLWDSVGRLSNDACRLAVAGSYTLRAWDVPTRREVPLLPDPRDRANAIAFTADGQFLAVLSSGDPRGIQLWELRSRQTCLHLETGKEDSTCLAVAPNGRILAVGSDGGTIRLWDLVTRRPLARLAGHPGRVVALQFSPDGQTLYSASEDTTVLLWDVARLTPPLAPLPAAKVAACWAELADADAARAYRASWSLVSAGAAAVEMLSRRLQPVAPPDGAEVSRRIAELDSDDYDPRQAAVERLIQLDTIAEPAVRQALRGNVSLETRRRLRHVLQAIEGVPPPEELRGLRAVQVLEHIGTPEAHTLLRTLAEGAVGTRRTLAAREALERLSRCR
jgi:WD40 repeat protein